MTTKIKTYSELVKFSNFMDRYRYLKLDGDVANETFGFDRYLNQVFYRSPEWKKLRNEIIVRDNGCDLGVEGFELHGRIYIHHMNPITKLDLLNRTDYLMNPEFLISVSFDTHNAIHYGNEESLPLILTDRRQNDTCPWKKQ